MNVTPNPLIIEIEKSGTSCSTTKFCSTTLISEILLLPCLIQLICDSTRYDKQSQYTVLCDLSWCGFGDVYIFKYAKKYLLCRPFVWLHLLEGFKRFQCPVQNLQSSINWFQSSCAWSSYLDLLLYACALCTQPNPTKRRFSNRLKTSLKENGFASEAGSTFHIQCCKVGVGRIVNLHVHIRIHVFLLLVINSNEQKLGKAGAELNGVDTWECHIWHPWTPSFPKI